MSEHTPGPWEIRERTVGDPPRLIRIEINAPTGIGRMEHPVCQIPSGFTNQAEDARLIAAAPELLAACKAALPVIADAIVRGMPITAKVADARNSLCEAIAKAEGGRP